MIEKEGSVQHSVSVKDKNGNSFPEIEHQGATYVVCRAEQEFKVEVSCSPPNNLFWAALFIDGKDIGTWKVLDGKEGKATFQGWNIDHKTKKAFLFSAPDLRADTSATSNHLDTDTDIGTIKVLFEECESYPCPALKGKKCSRCDCSGHGTRTITRVAPETAGSISQVDGKKFFLQPSLGAKAGAKITEVQSSKKRFHHRRKTGGRSHTMRMRFETAPILQLRKILLPSNPDHLKLLQADNRAEDTPSQREETSEKMDSKRAVSTAALGRVKKESGGVKQEKRKHPEARTIVTIDLTEDTEEDQECMTYTVTKRLKVERAPLLVN